MSTAQPALQILPEFRDVDLPTKPEIRCVGDAFGRSVAVVLGINHYAHGIPSLKTAVPDAEAVAALLDTEHDFTTVLRRDGEVTGDEIRALFEREIGDRLGGPLGSCDRLLFTSPVMGCRPRASAVRRVTCCSPMPISPTGGPCSR